MMMSSRMMLTMNGGLGNQLFQFSYLHRIAKRNGNKVAIYFPKPKDEAREFVLGSLCKNCEHVSSLSLNRNRWLDFRSNLLDFSKFRIPLFYRLVISKFVYSETNPYEYDEFMLSQTTYSGYFQNWKYVDEVITEVENELNLVLEPEWESISHQFPSLERAVLHFRRGDLVKYSHTMGVLDLDYFARALEAAMHNWGREIRLSILTDDKDAAIQEFPNLVADIYGPADLSEWQALALMSKAKFVITSNSTFSWWGGLLALRNGGQVYIPDPWFLQWNPIPGDAFHYPGFKVIRSSFK